MSARFRGLFAAMVTPFSDDGGQVSEPRLAAYCEFLIAQGVDGLFAFGTTGEWPLLSEEERIGGARALVRQAAGRVPVIVHAGAHGTAQAIRLARAAREAGAAAASLISPPFYPLDQEALLEHFTAVARAVPGFPVFLYNITEYAGNDIVPELLLRVAGKSDNVIGLKYSGDSLERFSEYRRVMGPDFSLFNGNDGLALRALAEGADGLVSGNASARPELLVSLYAVFKEGDHATAAGKQRELDEFIAGRAGASELSFFKALLALRGVPVGDVRPPLARLGAEGRAALRRWLD
jgi:dihydrodipicolinate synthase/N-acetylneuraminate lyase